MYLYANYGIKPIVPRLLTHFSNRFCIYIDFLRKNKKYFTYIHSHKRDGCSTVNVRLFSSYFDLPTLADQVAR